MNERRRTQEKSVLNTLQRGDTITPIQAMNQCGTMRLAAIIHTLRKKGHNITTSINKVNVGDTGNFATYSMAT